MCMICSHFSICQYKYISLIYKTLDKNIFLVDSIKFIKPFLSLNRKMDIDIKNIGHIIFGKSFSKIEKIYDDSGVHKMTEPYFNNGILIIQFLFLIYIFVHNKKRLHI